MIIIDTTALITIHNENLNILHVKRNTKKTLLIYNNNLSKIRT